KLSVLEQFVLQRYTTLAPAHFQQKWFYALLELFQSHVLRQIVGGTLLDGLACRFCAVLPSEQNDLRAGIEFKDALEEIHSTHLRHHQITQDQVGVFFSDEFKSVTRAAGSGHHYILS